MVHFHVSSFPLSSCFPVPPAFPPVDTSWKALHRPANTGLVLVVGIQAGCLWFALEKHLEKQMWVFHEANHLHPRSEIQWEWEAKHRGGQQRWWSLQREGEVFGLFFFFRISIYGFAWCFLLSDWCSVLFFPAVTYVHIAVANSNFGGKLTWMMWSSKAMFLRCRPKHTLVKRKHLNCLQILHFLSEKCNNKFSQQNLGMSPAYVSFGTSAVLIV